MSKYVLAEFPQEEYRFALYDNVRKLTWREIQEETGCCGLVNLWYFGLTTYTHEAAVMLEGKWAKAPAYDWPGLLIDRNGRASVGGIGGARWDYAASVQADYIGGKRSNTTAWGRNGVTYTGLKKDGTVVLLLASKDAGLTSQEAVEVMRSAGCVNILRWDGSWSSQGSLGPGKEVQPSQRRICRGWLLIFKRDAEKEEKPVSKKVCLDPGHGVETAGKRSPDGSYREYEFAMDMAQRMKTILERHGVEVFLTREGEHDVSLPDRVKKANAIKDLNLFVSLHSNAAGSGSAWMSARGYEIYTSAPGETAGRNIAAKKILQRAKEAGITVRSMEPKHLSLYVCRHTVAPALLIEHLFHDNREDVALLKSSQWRQTAAEANCKGILDFLGISWQEEAAGESAPWYAQAQAWAVEQGISDGTRPLENATRAEVWEMLRKGSIA